MVDVDLGSESVDAILYSTDEKQGEKNKKHRRELELNAKRRPDRLWFRR